MIGSKKEVRRLQKELDNDPLKLCKRNMKQVKLLKYLGDFLHSELSEAVHQTVLKRVNVATMTIYEIRAVVEDRRAKCLGGINVGISIFTSSVIPMIFYNSETWSCMKKKTFKLLTEFICRFFRCIFRIGAGAPIPNFFWQTGLLLPENVVLQRQLNFFYHLATLTDGSLAKDVFLKQQERPMRGLVKELKDHTDTTGDPNVFSKNLWEKRVSQYTKEKNKNELIEIAAKYKKIDAEEWKGEKFERKDFFNNLDLEGTRMMMRIKGGMVSTIRSNFKNKYRNQSLNCQYCKGKSRGQNSDENIKECEEYDGIRNQIDVKSDAGLVQFFTKVVKRRIRDGND